MPKYIDISVAISPQLPRWPGSPPIQFTREIDIEQGDIATDTTIQFSVHTGTHVDAPSHFIVGGKSVESLPLEILIGEATVIDLSTIDVIRSDHLKQLEIPSETKRLLIRTKNSRLWQQKSHDFDPNFVALTVDAAQWLVDQGIKLVGIDYLSIQCFDDGPETHQILLGAEVIIVEGLNLANVSAGKYNLMCLPIKLQGVEGAPARVILSYLS